MFVIAWFGQRTKLIPEQSQRAWSIRRWFPCRMRRDYSGLRCMAVKDSETGIRSGIAAAETPANMKRLKRTDHTSKKLLVPTIFHEPWWMDATSDGTYREATVSMGGVVVGRLPYLLTKKFGGLKTIGQPLVTRVLGPALATEFTGTNFPRSLKQLTIIRDLIHQLPKVSHVSFRLHDGVTDTLAFDAAGFSTSVDFTVEIPPASKEVMWRQMRDKTRNVIRRAQERLTVSEWVDPRQFLDFYEANLRERGLRNHYDQRICLNIITECLQRKAGRLVMATDPSGNVQSANFTIWDHQKEYYFMSTRTRASMNGATSLLIWTALQHAASKDLRFDMDGVHINHESLPNILLLTGFGGVIRPRYLVKWSSALVQAGQNLKQLVVR